MNSMPFPYQFHFIHIIALNSALSHIFIYILIYFSVSFPCKFSILRCEKTHLSVPLPYKFNILMCIIFQYCFSTVSVRIQYFKIRKICRFRMVSVCFPYRFSTLRYGKVTKTVPFIRKILFGIPYFSYCL